MNKLQKILGVGTLTIALPILASGCKYEFDIPANSPVKQKEAVVVSMKHTPKYDQLDPVMITLGMVMIEDESFSVKFKGKNAVFESDYGQIYKKFKAIGEKAVVSYKEIQNDRYSRDGKWWEAFLCLPKFDSKTQFMYRDLKGYKVLDAQPTDNSQK
ncbi:MAG: hypothetical protein V1660_02520 [archaeon]